MAARWETRLNQIDDEDTDWCGEKRRSEARRIFLMNFLFSFPWQDHNSLENIINYELSFVSLPMKVNSISKLCSYHGKDSKLVCSVKSHMKSGNVQILRIIDTMDHIIILEQSHRDKNMENNLQKYYKLWLMKFILRAMLTCKRRLNPWQFAHDDVAGEWKFWQEEWKRRSWRFY